MLAAGLAAFPMDHPQTQSCIYSSVSCMHIHKDGERGRPAGLQLVKVKFPGQYKEGLDTNKQNNPQLSAHSEAHITSSYKHRQSQLFNSFQDGSAGRGGQGDSCTCALKVRKQFSYIFPPTTELSNILTIFWAKKTLNNKRIPQSGSRVCSELLFLIKEFFLPTSIKHQEP